MDSSRCWWTAKMITAMMQKSMTKCRTKPPSDRHMAMTQVVRVSTIWRRRVMIFILMNLILRPVVMMRMSWWVWVWGLGGVGSSTEVRDSQAQHRNRPWGSEMSLATNSMMQNSSKNSTTTLCLLVAARKSSPRAFQGLKNRLTFSHLMISNTMGIHTILVGRVLGIQIISATLVVSARPSSISTTREMMTKFSESRDSPVCTKVRVQLMMSWQQKREKVDLFTMCRQNRLNTMRLQPKFQFFSTLRMNTRYESSPTKQSVYSYMNSPLASSEYVSSTEDTTPDGCKNVTPGQMLTGKYLTAIASLLATSYVALFIQAFLIKLGLMTGLTIMLILCFFLLMMKNLRHSCTFSSRQMVSLALVSQGMIFQQFSPQTSNRSGEVSSTVVSSLKQKSSFLSTRVHSSVKVHPSLLWVSMQKSTHLAMILLRAAKDSSFLVMGSLNIKKLQMACTGRGPWSRSSRNSRAKTSLKGSYLKYSSGLRQLQTLHMSLAWTMMVLAKVASPPLELWNSQLILWCPQLLSPTVWMMTILVPLTNCVLTGSHRIISLVSYRKDAELLCRIMIVGLSGLMSKSLSTIEKTSYLMIASARRVSSEPSSKEMMVSLLMTRNSLKYSSTATIS